MIPRYAVSLTTIPPRFDRLGPVLNSLLAQSPAPEFILLALPRRYARFPGAVLPPDLPSGVNILWAEKDYGPATKVLPAAEALVGKGLRLLYCDDDWIYGPGWAAALLDEDRQVATTGSAWGVERLGRIGTGCDIAQGFSGVSVRPEWLAGPEFTPPDCARSVDDVWLSGQLARQGIPVAQAPAARALIQTAFDDAHALQDMMADGLSRDAANRATAALLHAHFGIWPQRQASSTARAARS